MIISKLFFLLENEKRLIEEWFTAEFSVTLRVIVKEKNKLSWFAPDKDLLRELRDIVGFYGTNDNLNFRSGNAFIHTTATWFPTKSKTCFFV